MSLQVPNLPEKNKSLTVGLSVAKYISEPSPISRDASGRLSRKKNGRGKSRTQHNLLPHTF